MEALKISKDLLQVSVDTRTSHMIEFTCSKEGSFDYDIKFEFQGDTYRIVGIKKCSLSAIGKDFEVPSNPISTKKIKIFCLNFLNFF